MRSQSLIGFSPAAVLIVASLFAGCGGSIEPDTTTVTLQNDTDEVMYAQDWEWFRLVADGKVVSSTDTLCMKRCGDVFGGQVACALAARLATVVELAPGESLERVWDGIYYEIDEQRQCYREHPRGGVLEVEACYDDEFDDSGLVGEDDGADGRWEGGWIPEPTCERRAFERGDDVLISVE